MLGEADGVSVVIGCDDECGGSEDDDMAGTCEGGDGNEWFGTVVGC